MPISTNESVIAATHAWVEHAVIGLNLCPFARSVQIKNQIRYVVSEAHDEAGLLEDLRGELNRLANTSCDEIETTLLIHPQLLPDFLDFNEFLDAAEAAVTALGYDGVLQLASFHPHYQFAGTAAADVTNATNRSPYPTLHLLREESIDRAVAAFPAPETIFQNNMLTLQTLGAAGWAELQRLFQAR